MSIRKYAVLGLVTSTLVGSLYSFHRQSEPHIHKQKPKIVDVGEADFNRGDLVSYGFVACSAVVFDYDDSAFMAHAIPILLESEFYISGVKCITAGSVVDDLIHESRNYGLNPQDARVYVNCGEKKSLDVIIRKLRENHIPLYKADLRFEEGYIPQSEDSMTIIYSPSKDIMYTFKESGSENYRESSDISQWQGP